MSALPKLDAANDVGIVPSLLVSDKRLAELSGVFLQMNDLRGLPVESVLVSDKAQLLVLELKAEGALSLLETTARLAPETKVLVISDALSAPAVRAMLALNSSDIAAEAASATDISRAVGRLVEVVPDGPIRKNQCWVMTGAVGGAGATTLAIELACATAIRDSENSVCIVDLNLSDGMAAAYLEGTPKLDLHDLASAPERLDPTLLSAYVWQHETGVDLVSAKRNPDAYETTNPDIVLRLLDTVCSVYTQVIVDMPRHRSAWTKSVLGAVDEVLVVSEFTVPSLHAAADMAREVDSLRADAEPAKLVLNRMSDGKREFSIDRASTAIERDIVSVIRSDWKSAREAVNLGVPIARVKSKSVLVKDVVSLLQRLDPALTETGRKRLWR